MFPTRTTLTAEEAKALMSRRSRLAAQAKNTILTCQVPSCSKSRDGLGRWCRLHLQRQTMNGHPEGRFLARRVTEKYEEIWVQVVRHRWPSHPAIQAGEKWLESFVRDPRRYTHSQILIDRINGMYDRGVRGRELLQNLWGIYALSHWEPTVLRNNRAVKVQMAKRLLAANRKGRGKTGSPKDNVQWDGPLKQPSASLQELGGILHKHLAVLFLRLAERLDRDAGDLQTLRTELWTPFLDPSEVLAHQTFNLDSDKE